MTILYVSVDYPTTELNQLATTVNSSAISAEKLAGFYGYYIAVSLGTAIFFPVFWKYTIQYFNGETTPISTVEFILKFVRYGDDVFVYYKWIYQVVGNNPEQTDYIYEVTCGLDDVSIVILENLLFIGKECIIDYVDITSNIYGNIQVYI